MTKVSRAEFLKSHNIGTTSCRYCKRQVVFARCGEKTVCMDPTPPVYDIQAGLLGRVNARRLEFGLVSHHATCVEYQQQARRSYRQCPG